MHKKFRCNCPITSAIDIIGDRWSLVIIKHMLIEGRITFKDFIESKEAIATNILSDRLKKLEGFGILTKDKLATSKKSNCYLLTEIGLGLTPVILEMALWSDKHLRDIHPSIEDGKETELLKIDKTAFAMEIVKKYKEKLSKTLVFSQ